MAWAKFFFRQTSLANGIHTADLEREMNATAGGSELAYRTPSQPAPPARPTYGPRHREFPMTVTDPMATTTIHPTSRPGARTTTSASRR